MSDLDWEKLKAYFSDVLTTLDIKKLNSYFWFNRTVHFYLRGNEAQSKLKKANLLFTTIENMKTVRCARTISADARTSSRIRPTIHRPIEMSKRFRKKENAELIFSFTRVAAVKEKLSRTATSSFSAPPAVSSALVNAVRLQWNNVTINVHAPQPDRKAQDKAVSEAQEKEVAAS